MTSANGSLPHLIDQTCLTDAGLETWLIFQKGIELREFAAFELLQDPEGRSLLDAYFNPFLAMAARQNKGLVLETPTWRASPDWGETLGYTKKQIFDINREAVKYLDTLRRNFPHSGPVFVSGNLGPRGDGYDAGTIMSVAEAQDYHALQVDGLTHGRSDLISALTMTNVPEAIGIVRAAGEADIPCVVSFTLETDGRLPSGQGLRDAIEEMDSNVASRPAYYMINCAHPDHFQHVLEAGAEWTDRIKGLRANASRMSHAELDAAEELDDGDPLELGGLYRQLGTVLSDLRIIGGCCGTDHRHVEHMCAAMR
ncbi:MAG: homocysteine S-methyltransferase family protein [Alphaproteobacteria bacterium]|nr:homocysteine S-methyltransferase family protein [Alphaproteobacteria bacterium]